MPIVLRKESEVRESNFALILSILVWIPCLRFAMKRVSYIDNGIEKLKTFWSKLAFSILLIVFVICIVGLAGEIIELVGMLIQKLAEFFALPILRLFGLG